MDYIIGSGLQLWLWNIIWISLDIEKKSFRLLTYVYIYIYTCIYMYVYIHICIYSMIKKKGIPTHF